MTTRRRYLLLLLVLLLIGGAAALLQRILFPSGPRSLEVVSVTGDVSVVPAAGGAAQPLAAGAEIRPGDAVRTGRAGEAVMRGDGSATVTVREHSRVGVEGVLDGVSRFRLDEGRIEGRVNEGEGGGIQVSGGKDGAEVLTRGGKMAVGVDAGGTFAVAAMEGTATLSQGGTRRDLKAGEFAVVSGGNVEVGAIPTSVLLKVAWPEEGRTREKTATVDVQARPGTLLRVNDVSVAVGVDGRGQVPVELKEGENRVAVEAVDAVGNRTVGTSGAIVLDTRPPEIRGGAATWK